VTAVNIKHVEYRINGLFHKFPATRPCAGEGMLSMLVKNLSKIFFYLSKSLRSSMVSRSVRFGVRTRKLSYVGQSLDGWPKINYLEFLRASEGT
jgi:hypothetical protein